MAGHRCASDVEVQGWEPVRDGRADEGVPALQAPSFAGHPPNSTPSMSMRHTHVTRARAATCPDIYDFTFTPRTYTAPLQQQAGTSVSAYGSASESYAATSSRNAAAAGRSGSRPRSSTERKIARKLAENANYVPRPKNSFILFRTDFVAQRTGGGAHSDSSSRNSSSSNKSKCEEDDEDSSQSLSKQASEVWNKMSDEEKKPWVEQAKLEKAAHEAKYPHYRYKPVRHNSGRKNLLPPGSSKASQSPPRRPSLSLPRTISETSATPSSDAQDDGFSLSSAGDTDEQFSSFYQTSVAPSSVMALDSSLHMPTMSLPTASPSSSSLANALGSRPPTPVVLKGHAEPSLPSVPPVPALSLTAAGPSRAAGIPPIPRSPSAPIFDRHVVGQFPYQTQWNYFAAQSAAPSYAQGSGLLTFSTSSYDPSPSRTDAPTLVASEASSQEQDMSSPLSSISSSGVTTTPESTEPDCFKDFVRCDTDDASAGPAPQSTSLNRQQLFTNNETDYEKRHDESNTHYELDEMDLDMRALLNLSSLPEVAEPSKTSSSDVQRPFDAIAALWVQDQQRLNSSGGLIELQSEAPLQMAASPNQAHPQASSKILESVSTSPKNSAEQEPGLDTYGLTDYFNNCAANACLDDDLLRLDLDFRPTTSRSSCNATSALSFSALDGTADIMNESGDMFGYDRERGLYGFGSAAACGTELGIGNALDFGF